MIIALLAAQVAAADPKTREHAQAYRSCVLNKTRQLEPSGGTASEITSAALTACANARKDLEVFVWVDETFKADAKGEKADNRLVDLVMQKIDQRVVSDAQLSLLEARASRKRR